MNSDSSSCCAMSEAGLMIVSGFAFVLIGLGTWFYSYRPRTFVKQFVPRHKWRVAIRKIVHDPHFGNGMRIIAGLQLAMAAAMDAVGLYWYFGGS